jgi:hypothetical protein
MATYPNTQTLVICSDCSTEVPITSALCYEIIETIDGNQQNLVASNLRHTGVIGYKCDACVEAEIAEGEEG